MIGKRPVMPVRAHMGRTLPGKGLSRVVVFIFVLETILGALAGHAIAAPILVPGDMPVSSRLPLLIISEADRGGGERPDDLLSQCEKNGYVQGVSLFWSCPGAFNDLGEGAAQVAEIVNARASQIEGKRLDVIACGVSGLVARLSVDARLIPDGVIRNLVMVASPNKGSFAACVLTSIVEVAKHEKIFEKEGRGWNLLPSADDLLSLLGPKETGSSDYVRLTYPKDLTWTDETTWVAERVRMVYEPLYAKYVTARYSALPYIPTQSPKETFAGWIYRTMPQFWDNALKKSVTPPDGLPVYREGVASVDQIAPEPGRDLSAAYYELIAMEVAKNQYVMRTASKGSLLESLAKEPYLPSGWKDALLHYGAKALRYYAGKALLTAKAGVQDAVADRLVKRTGYIEGSSSALLHHLVKDEVAVNLGTSISQRFERVSGNSYLNSLNGTSLSRSRTRSTRYVSVAAKLASPWNLIWPQLGPNDFLLEVESALAPLGPNDVQKVFTGLFSPSGEGILESRDFQTFLFALLDEPLLATYTSAPAEAGAQSPLTDRSPVPNPANSSSGDLPSIDLSSPADGDDPDPALSGYPLVRVVNRSKRTTHVEPKETFHGYWLVDYGDGKTERIDGNPHLTLSHVFSQEGSYHVAAQSYDNRGDLLLERMWGVDIPAGDGSAQAAVKTFSCRSIPRLDAEVAIMGPVMWVTGKPAVYSIEFEADTDFDTEVVSVKYDPGQVFCVLWERSGDFVVSCAATVRLRYSIEGEVITVENTYVREIPVEILTTGVTQ